MMKIYGIPNCNTVKKAREWLTEHHFDTPFHDFKKNGVPEEQLGQWIETLGWEALVNRKGTTWRKLDAATQAAVNDAASAVAVLAQHPSAIRRPVVEAGGALLVGFDEAAWREALSSFAR